jgi:RNA-directed DNA polymerase
MDGDTSVNIDVAAWPETDAAWFAVRRMQLKLHRWASEDGARRFGDLFNLVYDPAFLMDAWERVAGNDGARTAGACRGHGGPDRDPGRGGRVPGPGAGLAENG